MKTLSELKKIAYILDDISIPNSTNRVIYYRLFNNLITNNQTIMLTEYQYKN